MPVSLFLLFIATASLWLQCRGEPHDSSLLRNAEQLCDSGGDGGDCSVASAKALNCTAANATVAPPCNFVFASLHLSAGAFVTCAEPDDCLIKLFVSGAVQLDAGSILSAPIIFLSGGNVNVEEGALIISDALGPLDGLGAPTTRGNGASHGGSGGALPCSASESLAERLGSSVPVTACCDGYARLSVNVSIGSFSSPTAAVWGSGGGGEGGGRGGGLITLNVSDTLTIDGVVSAGGGTPTNASSSGVFGSGSGGTVLLLASIVSGQGLVHANGGDGDNTATRYAAGSGGRVSVFVTRNLAFSVSNLQAFGGDASTACLVGAAGTVYVSIPDPTGITSDAYNQLIIASRPLAPFAPLAVVPLYLPQTPFDASGRNCTSAIADDCAQVDALTITNGASVAVDTLLLRTTSQASLSGISISAQGSILPISSAAVWDPAALASALARVPTRPPTTPNITIVVRDFIMYSAWMEVGQNAVFITCASFDARSGTGGSGSAGIAIDGVFSVRASDSIYVDVVIQSYDLWEAKRRMAIENGTLPQAARLHSPRPRDGASTIIYAPEIALYAANSLELEPNADLVEAVTTLYGGNVTISGRIENGMPAPVIAALCTVPLVTSWPTCTDATWLWSSALPPVLNYTLVIVATNALLLDSDGEVETTAALLCGASVTLQSFLSADETGCSGGQGEGAGSASLTAGGGGGHGGAGGDCIEPGGTGGPAYGSASEPLQLGSGGGSPFASNGGQGGGVVNIDAAEYVQLDSFARISASGNYPSVGAGGGAGGGISVRTYAIRGSGSIWADGGSGTAGGGGGAGGRIRFVSRLGHDFNRALREVGFLGEHGISQLDDNDYTINAEVLERAAFSDTASRAPQLRAALHRLSDALRGCNASAQSLPPRGIRRGVDNSCHDYANFWQLARAVTATSQRNGAPSSEQLLTRYANPVISPELNDMMYVPWETMLSVATGLGDIAADFTGDVSVSGGLGGLGANGANGTILAPPCPAGQGGVPRCLPCGLGYWRNGSSSVPFCNACTNKPLNGIYVDVQASSANCAYTCRSGYLYPSCMTPLEQLELAFGGTAGLVLTTAGTLLLLVLFLLVLCWRRKTAVEEFKRADAGVEAGVNRQRSDDHDDYPPTYLSWLPTWMTGRSRAGDGGEFFAGGDDDFVAAGRHGRRDGSRSAVKKALLSTLDTGTLRAGYGAAVTAGTFSRPSSTAHNESRAGGVTAAIQFLRDRRRADAGAPGAHRGRSTHPCTSWCGRGKTALPSFSAAEIDFLITSAALVEADLSRVGARIYLGGANRPGAPWRMPITPPGRANRLVHAAAYGATAAAVNSALSWSNFGWERFITLLLRLTFPPAASEFLQWRRRRRAGALFQAILVGLPAKGGVETSAAAPITGAGHSWLRGARAAALEDQLRVGMSADYTLAYVDVLRPERRSGGGAIEVAAAAKNQTRVRDSKRALPSLAAAGTAASLTASTEAQLRLRLPLVLLLAGDGSFEQPLYLEPNDVLVRAVPSVAGLHRFIDDEWIEFVAELNARSRTITAGAVIQTAGPLLALLKAVNSDPNILGGLVVELVRFWPTARSVHSDLRSLLHGGGAVDRVLRRRDNRRLLHQQYAQNGRAVGKRDESPATAGSISSARQSGTTSTLEVPPVFPSLLPSEPKESTSVVDILHPPVAHINRAVSVPAARLVHRVAVPSSSIARAAMGLDMAPASSPTPAATPATVSTARAAGASVSGATAAGDDDSDGSSSAASTASTSSSRTSRTSALQTKSNESVIGFRGSDASSEDKDAQLQTAGDRSFARLNVATDVGDVHRSSNSTNGHLGTDSVTMVANGSPVTPAAIPRATSAPAAAAVTEKRSATGIAIDTKKMTDVNYGVARASVPSVSSAGDAKDSKRQEVLDEGDNNVEDDDDEDGDWDDDEGASSSHVLRQSAVGVGHAHGLTTSPSSSHDAHRSTGTSSQRSFRADMLLGSHGIQTTQFIGDAVAGDTVDPKDARLGLLLRLRDAASSNRASGSRAGQISALTLPQLPGAIADGGGSMSRTATGGAGDEFQFGDPHVEVNGHAVGRHASPLLTSAKVAAMPPPLSLFDNLDTLDEWLAEGSTSVSAEGISSTTYVGAAAAPLQAANALDRKQRTLSPAGHRQPRDAALARRAAASGSTGSDLIRMRTVGEHRRRGGGVDRGPVVLHSYAATAVPPMNTGAGVELEWSSNGHGGTATSRRVGAASLAAVSAIFAPSIALLDAGGDDDAIGSHLDMTLPYPGARITADAPPDSLFSWSATRIALLARSIVARGRSVLVKAGFRRAESSRGLWPVVTSPDDRAHVPVADYRAPPVGVAAAALSGVGPDYSHRHNMDRVALAEAGVGVAAAPGTTQLLLAESDFMRRVIDADARMQRRRQRWQLRSRDARKSPKRNVRSSNSSSPRGARVSDGRDVNRTPQSTRSSGYDEHPHVTVPADGRRPLLLTPMSDASGALASPWRDGVAGEGSALDAHSALHPAAVLAASSAGLRSSGGSMSTDSSDDNDGRSEGRGNSRYNAHPDSGAKAARCYAVPASGRSLWRLGLDLANIWPSNRVPSQYPQDEARGDGGANVSTRSNTFAIALLAIRRLMLASTRILVRTGAPLPAAATDSLVAATVALHLFLVLLDLTLTVGMVSELFCVEPAADVVVSSMNSFRRLVALPQQVLRASNLITDKCNYVPVALYVSLPPLGLALPQLYGLVAVAMQNPKALRRYVVWNSTSIVSCIVAFILVAVNINVLNAQLLILPLGLLACKVVAAQCVPIQLSVSEASRPVRGWRGLFEVRTGPAEFAGARDSEFR